MAPSPNIVLIISDDHGYRHFGFMGSEIARTPHLDRLAAEGCRWPNTFSTAGVCAPARSAVITGMYPVSIGTHHMRTTHTHPATPEMPTPYSAVVPHYVKCFPDEYLKIWPIVDRYTKLLLFEKGKDGAQEIPLTEGDIILEQIDEFADCIRTGAKPETDGHGALVALALIRAAIDSARTGKPVELKV